MGVTPQVNIGQAFVVKLHPYEGLSKGLYVHTELGTVDHEAKKGTLAGDQAARAVLAGVVGHDDSKGKKKGRIIVVRKPAVVVAAEIDMFKQEGEGELRHVPETSPK